MIIYIEFTESFIQIEQQPRPIYYRALQYRLNIKKDVFN